MIVPFTMKSVPDDYENNPRWAAFVRAAGRFGVWDGNPRLLHGDVAECCHELRNVPIARDLEDPVEVDFEAWEETGLGRAWPVCPGASCWELISQLWSLASRVIVIDRHALKANPEIWDDLIKLRRDRCVEIDVLHEGYILAKSALVGKDEERARKDLDRQMENAGIIAAGPHRVASMTPKFYQKYHDRFMLFEAKDADNGAWWALTLGKGLSSIRSEHPTFVALLTQPESGRILEDAEAALEGRLPCWPQNIHHPK